MLIVGDILSLERENIFVQKEWQTSLKLFVQDNDPTLNSAKVLKVLSAVGFLNKRQRKTLNELFGPRFLEN